MKTLNNTKLFLTALLVGVVFASPLSIHADDETTTTTTEEVTTDDTSGSVIYDTTPTTDTSSFEDSSVDEE